MSNKISEENISLALRTIVDDFGKNILLDSSRVNSILNDLVPTLSKESNWIKEAIDMGIVKIFLDEKNIDDLSRETAINKVKIILKEEHLDLERIDFIVNSFAYALGWNNEKVDNKVNDIDNGDNSSKQSNNNSSNKNINPQDDKGIKSKKYKIIITVAAVIILCIVGIYLVNNLKSNNVYAKKVTFDIAYEKEDSKYIFKEEDFIVMRVYLDGDNPEKIDENKLSYEVDDLSVCNISNEFNRCRITGQGLGDTTIHIYYEGNEIKSIDLEFRQEDKN